MGGRQWPHCACQHRVDASWDIPHQLAVCWVTCGLMWGTLVHHKYESIVHNRRHGGVHQDSSARTSVAPLHAPIHRQPASPASLFLFWPAEPKLVIALRKNMPAASNAWSSARITRRVLGHFSARSSLCCLSVRLSWSLLSTGLSSTYRIEEGCQIPAAPICVCHAFQPSAGWCLAATVI
jgi:hypothetical protein